MIRRRPDPTRLTAVLLLALGVRAPAQEIRESDLYFADPANLARLVDEAALARTEGRLEVALGKLESVLAASAAGEAGATDALVVRARLLRAEIRFADGDAATAEEDLAEALRIAPHAAPEAGATGKFLKLYGAVRKRSIGSLTVRSDPPGATVWVNGRAIGVTPLVEAPVALGAQFLRVTRVGFEAIDREVAVQTARSPEVSVVLRRRHATFLLMTNADPTEVRLDGEAMGLATRPTREQADELIATFNLPIDPYDPSPLLLLREAPTGQHVLELSAACHRPLRRVVEIPEGADSTSMVALEPAHGSLRVTGPLDVEIWIDGIAAGVPPIVNEQLCPGPHVVEVTERSGRRTRATVVVAAATRAEWAVRFRPVLTLLTDDPAVRDAFLTLEPWNVVIPAGLAAANPSQLLDGAGVNRDRVSRLVAAHDAALLAWTTGTNFGRELWLLAATANVPERMAIGGPDDLEQALLRLARPLVLYRQHLGIVVVETRLFAHPVVATMAEGGLANRAGLRIGDELIAIDGAAIDSLRAFDAAIAGRAAGDRVTLNLLRPTGAVDVTVEVERGLAGLEFAAAGRSPSAGIATLEDAIRATKPDDRRLSDLRFALGRAYAELGDWPSSHAALQGARPDDLGREEAGRLLYHRGLAALAVDAPGAAAAALRGSLSYPEARLLGLDAPFVRTQVEPLLIELDTLGSEP